VRSIAAASSASSSGLGTRSLAPACIACTIARVLDGTHWNRRRAARLLGVSYKTLLAKIRECELSPE
jgi:DNA-binding NtrC family response regulator